jgi:hypothetical protein
MKQTFNLKDIYKYAIVDKNFDIPTVQRGYVWKAYQIENLWDSLLRGYPIGAIVLSKNDKEKLNILDGQQRITSICLGMCQEKVATILKATSDNYKLFIDLEKPPSKDSRKYYFRVITRSHPWGYSKSDNRKTLEKNKVNSFYDKLIPSGQSFFDINLSDVYPYDSKFPIPFHIFVSSALNGNNITEVRSKVIDWAEKAGLGQSFEEYDESERTYRVQEIYHSVQRLLCDEKGIKVPALYFDIKFIDLDSSDRKGNEANAINKAEGFDVNKEEIDDIENMFVRMNSAGTPLSGEELNYSLLKTYLDEESVKCIEDICESKYNPARLVTIFYRLWKHGSGGESFFRVSVSPKDFQLEIREGCKRDDFKNFLLENIKSVSELENLLLYKRSNSIGLPLLIVRGISQRAPELFYILLFRIIFKRDDFSHASAVKKLIGAVTILYWLGKGEQKKGYEQLLRNIFPILHKADFELFWSSSLIQRAMINPSKGQVLPELPANTDELCNCFDYKSKGFSKSGIKGISLFVYLITREKDLILYNQRDYISTKFDNKLFCLVDTNVPFDWDHIFPQSYIKSRKGINEELKAWYQTNGNFWACSYGYNRSFQDASPSIKLNKDKLSEEGISYDQIQVDPNELITLNISSESFSQKNKSRVANQKSVQKFLIERNRRLISKWYTDLGLENLIPKKYTKLEEDTFFEEFFKNDKSWQVPEGSLRKGDPDGLYSVYYEMKIDDEYSIYFGACGEGLLFKDDIEAGVISSKKLKNIKSDDADSLDMDGYFATYNVFTLISTATVASLFLEVAAYFREVSELNNLTNLKINERFLKTLNISFKMD